MKEQTALAHTLRQADQLIQAGRLQQASSLLRQVLKRLPRHPQAHSRLGTLLMRIGHTEEAIRHLHTACEAQPNVLFHWLRLLSAYQQTGNVQQARHVLEQATTHRWPTQAMEQLAKVAFEPPDQRQRGLLALHQSGQDVLTTEIAARLFINDYPDHPLGWQILGALLHNAGRLEEALELQQQTTARFPKDANAHNNLSLTLLALQRYEDALVSARTALKLNPALAQAQAHEREALTGLKAAVQAA